MCNLVQVEDFAILKYGDSPAEVTEIGDFENLCPSFVRVAMLPNETIFGLPLVGIFVLHKRRTNSMLPGFTIQVAIYVYNRPVSY